MASMDQMKGWLIKKCRDAPRFSPSSTPSGSSNASKYRDICRVVTPNNIPEFIIPKSNETSPTGNKDLLATEQNRRSPSSERGFDGCSGSSSPFPSPMPSPSPRGSSPLLFLPPSPHHSQSAPCSPNHGAHSTGSSPAHSVKSLDTRSLEGETLAKTNADPASLAAMSLTHFKTRTSFGFETLTERPHTLRRESLFHVEKKQENLQRSMSLGIFHGEGNRVVHANGKNKRSQSVRKNKEKPPILRETSSEQCTPSTSPACSPLNSPSDFICGSSAQVLEKQNQGQVYYRRRSSLPPIADSECPLCSDCSNPEAQHQQLVKAFDDAHQKQKSKSQFNRSYSVQSSMGWPRRSGSCTHHKAQPNQDDIKSVAHHGEVKLAIQYQPKLKELKVSLIRAENLGQYYPCPINPFIRLSLLPCKLQKQQSRIIKGTKDPVFNQSFQFGGLSLAQLQGLSLKLKVLHKASNIRREELLGETIIPLNDLDLHKENRIWRNLVNKCEHEDLGNLHISCCFEPNNEKLRVAVIAATGLPRNNLTGAPDAYVKVVLSQPGKPVIKQQTKIKRRTNSPTFNETFALDISPKLEDLKYTTLTFTVFDHEHLRSDEVIGRVQLGSEAEGHNEFIHWCQILQGPGREFEFVHKIKEHKAF